MFDDEFNDYLEENSPLQELLKEKLINIYRDKNIDELRTIIIDIEMKNLSLLKEIENLKFNLMKIQQELIDAKNSQKLINKNNLNYIENYNEFYVDNFNKDLRLENEDLIKKELSIKLNDNEYEYNELFNNNNFDELKINPKIINKYIDNNDIKNFIYEISNEMKNIIQKNNLKNFNDNQNLNNNNYNNYNSNFENLGFKMQEIKNYLNDLKKINFNSNNLQNFTNNKKNNFQNKNKNNNIDNYLINNQSNYINSNQNNKRNNIIEKENLSQGNYSHSKLNSLNSINSQQKNNNIKQNNSSPINYSEKRYNTLPNRNYSNLSNDIYPLNENNKKRNNFSNSKKNNSKKEKELNNNINKNKK